MGGNEMNSKTKPVTGSKALFAALLCASSMAFAEHEFFAPGIMIDGETISSEGDFKTKSGNKYTYMIHESIAGDVMGLLLLTQKNGTYELSGQDTTSCAAIWVNADCTIVLEDGFELGSADAGLNYDTQGSSFVMSPIMLQTGSTVTIRTKGRAVIYGNYNMPAICVGGMSDNLVSMLILEEDGSYGGTGGLFAYGGYGAPAIGSMRNTTNGLGIISVRGAVYAFAGEGACAIGIAPECDVPKTKKSYINVGSMTANGSCTLGARSCGESPAIGISGGASGLLDVYLNNGIISAFVQEDGSDESAAGIGTGCRSEGECNIFVNGGEITAKGGKRGAGIGSGCESGADVSITILGGRIDANGGAYAAGIGGGYCTKTPDIYIAGGTVVASGDSKCANDIGSGYGSLSDVDVRVAGGSVWPENEKYDAVFTCNGTRLVCLWTDKASASEEFRPGQKVNVLLVTENGPYGNKDIYASEYAGEAGRVYLWVPPALYKNNLFMNGEKYYADARSGNNTSPTPKGAANVCIVDFDAGTGDLKARDERRFVEYGNEVGTLPKATKKGYTLRGWYTKKSGGTKVVNSTTKVKEDVTYYAEWMANKYKIKFNKNGGKGKMKTLSATYGKLVKLTANAFKKSRYKFAGWAKTKKGRVVYKNKAKVKNLTTKSGKTITLYAVWKKR